MYYIIGSLANKQVLATAKALREAGIDAFDQWMAAGEGADQHWWAYGKQRGLNWKDTLGLDFVQTAFHFDLAHMEAAEGCVLVMPAGKSAHCELGWFVGARKKAYILYDGEPERADLMPANLATDIFTSVEDLIDALKPSTDQLHKERSADRGVLCNPAESYYCGTCPDCVRMFGHLGRGGLLVCTGPSNLG